MPQPLDIWQRGHIEPSLVSDALLRARLAQAIAWCDSLHSMDDLQPGSLGPREFHDPPDDGLVCDLGARRQLRLQRGQLTVPHQSPVIATGRFMLYFPDDNLSDGYAELVSDAFFDVDNVPACDTWVSFFVEPGRPGGHLLCYVPAFALERAAAGIEGNPEACIVWLDESNALIRRRVDGLTRRPAAGAGFPWRRL